MGVRRATKNPAFAAAKKEIKKHRRLAGKVEAETEAICGVIAEFQALKDQALVSCHPDAEEIYFHNPETMQGKYTYLFDFKSNEHIKSIYLPAGCDPEKAVLWINFAGGFGRLAGKVLWLTPGASRETTFSFVAIQGGDESYRREFNRPKSEHWQRIDLFHLLNPELQATSNAAASKN